MRQRHPRNLWWLLLGLISISGAAWFVNTYPPVSWQLIAVFFIFLFVSSLCIFLYLLNNVRHALLVSLGVILFLILRYLNLRQSYYIVLLVASLASLEIALRKR